MMWYVDSVPHDYYGVFVLRGALGRMRDFIGSPPGHVPNYQKVGDPLSSLGSATRPDVFAMGFVYDDRAKRFHTSFLAGVTEDREPDNLSVKRSGALLWDFRRCRSADLTSWKGVNTSVSCNTHGLSLSSTGEDVHLENLTLTQPLRAAGKGFVRLRVAVGYTASTGEVPASSTLRWYWHGPGGSYTEEQSKTLPLRQDGHNHVYWAYIPASELGTGITAMRFASGGLLGGFM